MNSIRKVVAGVGLFLALPGLALADAAPDGFSYVNDALTSGTTLFGSVITLAVLVTGFFVGRSWLRRAK